jgi:hypothetical protein
VKLFSKNRRFQDFLQWLAAGNVNYIIPWAENEEERLNTENGICLSPLYDRAYDI